MNPTNNIRTSIMPALLLLGLLFTPADAQGALEGATPTGTITGTLDGTSFDWRTLEADTQDGMQNTANYNVLMDMFYNYTIQGHQGGSLIEGAVSITFSSLNGPLSNCPCELAGDISYWTTTSMFDDVYMDHEAVITVLEVEEMADGTLRLVGTAQGQLDLYENVMTQEPTGDPVAVTLEFTVDRASLVELDY